MAKRMITTPAVWAVLFSVLGCAGMIDTDAPPEASRNNLPPTAYVLELTVASDLARPYYVTAGPIESYRPFPVTERFTSRLESRIQNISSPSGDRGAQVSVRLLHLDTWYDQIGGLPAPPADRSLRYATATRGLGLLSEFGDGWTNPVPEEIQKGATLTLELEIRAPDRPPYAETLTVDHQQVVDRWDFDPRWAYEYGPVIEGLLKEAVNLVTVRVWEVLRPGSRGGGRR